VIMRGLLLVVALLFVGELAFGAPTRPVISEIFSTTTTIQIEILNRTLVRGAGIWITSQPHGKMLERYEFPGFNHIHEDIYRLERFDLERTFEIIQIGERNSSCIVRTDRGPMPAVWGWLSQATYSTIRLNGTTYDYWSVSVGFAMTGVAVTSANPNQPVYLILEGPDRATIIAFVTWNTSPPKEAHFDIPPSCQSTSRPSLTCEARTTMIDRAEVWVANKVPYNQGATYQGYREDCSGYVSMAWEAAKPGYTTETLPQISHPISKGELQPGDILLCRTEHVVLFGGWTSGGDYIAYEETKPGEGTVRRATPYPYWYNTACFQPYRYNSVC